MRLTIQIDGTSHTIDSTDPELLGKWVIEIFGRAIAFGINQATYIQVQAYPSWVADGGNGRPDWITDSRIIGNVYQIRSPADLVAALGRQLDEAAALHD